MPASPAGSSRYPYTCPIWGRIRPFTVQAISRSGTSVVMVTVTS